MLVNKILHNILYHIVRLEEGRKVGDVLNDLLPDEIEFMSSSCYLEKSPKFHRSEYLDHVVRRHPYLIVKWVNAFFKVVQNRKKIAFFRVFRMPSKFKAIFTHDYPVLKSSKSGYCHCPRVISPFRSHSPV